jgi:SAM-dependent methyltransferase
MTPLAETGPNAEQIRYWNEQAGPVWLANQAALDLRLARFGELVLERARVVAGERVLDVGCGCGATALELGRRVGPAGGVLGVDISQPMLERARERARAAGAANVAFESGDAQSFAFDPECFDLVFSRFGVMFFSDPPSAFANLLRALRPGGRLAFVCWQEPARNPWLSVPMRAVAAHVPLPPPAAPDAPGPFAFADPVRTAGILQRGGFEQVVLAPVETTFDVGSTLDEAVEFALTVGPAAALLRDAPPDAVARAREAVRAAVAPHATAQGVSFGASVWVATARRD